MTIVRENINVEIRRVRPGARIPAYKSEMAAGMDLHACIDEPIVLRPNDPAVLIPTGIAIHIGQAGFVGIMVPRSGLGHKGLVLGNGTGIIDADYQGELMVSAWNRSSYIHPADGNRSIPIEPGDRIAQLLIMPVVTAYFQLVNDFTQDSIRGTAGFGSTGV